MSQYAARKCGAINDEVLMHLILRPGWEGGREGREGGREGRERRVGGLGRGGEGRGEGGEGKEGGREGRKGEKGWEVGGGRGGVHACRRGKAWSCNVTGLHCTCTWMCVTNSSCWLKSTRPLALTQSEILVVNQPNHDSDPPEVDITALLREEGHWHCRNCVLSTCSKEQAKCPTRQCPNGCGSAMHSCKLDEHLEHVCSETHVPCSNAIYGCEELMRRGNLVTHLEHCSASIVMCRFSHDRMSVEFLGEKDCSPREPLLDEKLLLGDLAILQDRNRVISCTVSLPLGTGGRYLKGDPSDQSSDQPRDLDIQCTVGIVTNASQSSHYHTKSLTPRKRTCVNVDVKIQHHFIKRPVLTKQCCAFSCNEIVRRDEFAAHWKTLHLDIQVDMPTIIERCPMHAYGCMHGEQRLVPNPRGSSLDYDQETDCLLLKCPETVTTDPQSTSEYATKIQAKQELALYGYEDDSDESFDVLGQLPVEILMAITEYLDSQSLWHLSLVNHYLRKVCLNVVKKRGIVYCQWTFDGATQGWICGPKVGPIAL